MKKYITNLLNLTLLTFAVTLTQPAFATNDVTASTMDDLSAEVSADKRLVVAHNMDMTDAEAKAFWPIYEAYQKDLYLINQRVANVINEYALAYNKGAVLNDTAKRLLNEAIAIELDEAKLKQTYVPKLSKALPAAKVARYIQIETKIRAVIRYQLAEAIPLVK